MFNFASSVAASSRAAVRRSSALTLATGFAGSLVTAVAVETGVERDVRSGTSRSAESHEHAEVTVVASATQVEVHRFIWIY